MRKGRVRDVGRVGLVLVVMAVALVVGGGVALAAVKQGTGGRDSLVGTVDGDVLDGGGAGDFLAGKGGDDVLFGGDGDDLIHGGAVGWGMAPDGEDRLFGGRGSDCMFGGSEDDVLHGGPGNDDMGHYCYEFIFDRGEDTFYGDKGDDEIIALEDTKTQERDVVFCGSGTDTVYYREGVDRLFGCERKKSPR